MTELEEQVAQNNTTLNLYTTNSLSGSDGFESHRNLVKSWSSLCKWACKNAFSMSVDIINL